MSHELDRNEETGKAAMFAVVKDVVRDTPWHREGTYVGGAPTFEEALKLGGIDFEVAMLPLKVDMPITGSEGDCYPVEVPKYRAVYCMDRPAQRGILGVVGKDYHLLQNRDAFRVLEPLLDAGVAELDTGGTLRDGMDTWMQIKFKIDDPFVSEVMDGDDKIIPFGLISNNHSGQRKVVLRPTPVRVVCANTLDMALSKHGGDPAIKIRHTANVGRRVIEAAEQLFGQFAYKYHVIAEQYAALKAAQFSEADFKRAVLDLIAELPAAPAPDASKAQVGQYEKAKERAEKKRNRLIFLRDNGTGNKGDGSAWEAYNAVTESIDHDFDIWKVQDPSRANALFDGSIGRYKRAALNAIYQTVLAKNAKTKLPTKFRKR